VTTVSRNTHLIVSVSGGKITMDKIKEHAFVIVVVWEHRM